MASSSSVPSPIKLEPPGQREVVDDGKAKEFVKFWTAQLLDHRKKILAANGNDDGETYGIILCDHIRLSDKTYTADAAMIIASFLKEPFEGSMPLAHGIVEADLSDIIASRKTEEGLQVLRTVCDAFVDSKLVGVDLSDNAIGQQGIGACKTVLSKKSLERLALCNNGLSEETMAQVADILTSDEDGTGCIASNLTKIHFFNNMSGDGGCKEFARILDKSAKLVDIRFSSTRGGREGSYIVASALDASLAEGHNPNLVKLDLCGNSFATKASYEAICRVLGTTASVTYLDLCDCDLEDDGVEKICHALFESDSALEHLDLSGNGVEKRGAKHIADYLRNCGGKLKNLYLEDNELTSKGVGSIAAAFHSEDCHSIEEIKLNTCLVGAIGARALIDSFGADGNLPNLKKIFLNGNSFNEAMLGELTAAFDERLGDLDDNDDDDDADDDLSDDDEEANEEEDEIVDSVDNSVDNLAEAMGKSLVV